MAKAWSRDIYGVQVSADNSGAKTCSFTSSLSIGIGAPPTILFCYLTYMGGPGANTPSYFAQALAKNNITNSTPVPGIGTKALISDGQLWVLTKHGVAVVQAMDPDGDEQAKDIAIYHAVEHSL